MVHRGVGERSCVDIWGKNIRAKRRVCTKALRQDGAGMLEEEQVSVGDREGRAWRGRCAVGALAAAPVTIIELAGG